MATHNQVSFRLNTVLSLMQLVLFAVCMATGANFIAPLAFLLFVNGPLAISAGIQAHKEKALVAGDTNKALPSTHRMSRHHKKNVATEFDCAKYSDRLFEQKLVDGGVMKVIDMTTCEDNDCPNCKPTHDAVKAKNELERQSKIAERKRKQYSELNVPKNESDWDKFQQLKKSDPRWRGYTYKDYLFQMKMKNADFRAKPYAINQPKEIETLVECKVCAKFTTNQSGTCSACKTEIAEKKKRNAEAQQKALMRRGNESYVEINGVKFKRPSNVPRFATAAVYYDANMLTDFILWQWQYGDTQKLSYRQNFDAESYEVQDAGGRIISQWQSIYDPDTGEHLGDIKMNPDGTTTSRNPRPPEFETEKRAI